LALVASALDGKLFLVADIHDVGYWVAKIESEVVIHPFIVGYGYATSLQKLIRLYRHKESDYKNWVFPANGPAPEPRARKSKAAAAKRAPVPIRKMPDDQLAWRADDVAGSEIRVAAMGLG